MKIEKREIVLSNGSILQVEFTPQFLTCVRSQFALKDDDVITNDHIRIYFYDVIKDALREEDERRTY